MMDLAVFGAIAGLGLLVQSIVGFAGSLVAIPLLALFMSPRDAVPAYCFTMLTVNIFLVCEGRRHVAWRAVGGLLAGGLPGVPVGAYALKYLPVHIIGAVISIVTMAFGLLFLAKVRIRFPAHPLTVPSIGLLSGVLGGSISESGPPVVVYALTREWPKDVFRSSLLAYFLCLGITAAVSYLVLGMVHQRHLWLWAAGVVPGLATAHLGVWLKQRINEQTFRLTVLITIIAVGVLGLAKHLT